MVNGLDLFEVQNDILAYLEQNLGAAGYEVHEGDIGDSVSREYVNGVNQVTCVIQFGDLLPSAKDKSFGGPTLDGYYSLVRVMSIAQSPALARKANSIVNQLMIGYRIPNSGSIHKEGGGGSYAIGEANTKPVAYGLLSSYRFLTNISNPGGTVELP